MTENLEDYIGAYGEGFGYAFDNHIILDWYPKRIMQLHSDGGSLLELGIGHGYTTDRFSRHFSRHLVIDGSLAIIEQFRSQYPDCSAEIVRGYFEEFESDERFDVIVLGFVLEHVSSPCEILEMYKKFLAPGGSVFVSVPNGQIPAPSHWPRCGAVGRHDDVGEGRH
ncbi:Ubiquinone biosynthesis O-methyltransferase, mitochondrial [Castellaniella defragrans]